MDQFEKTSKVIYRAISASGLTKFYGSNRAVDGIDFSVLRGETFGFLGPNGAGKSTTMRMIACRTPPTAGELLVEGINVRDGGRRIRSMIGVVPQENNLDPDLSVRQNLLIYSRYYQMNRMEAASRSDELLRFVGLINRAGSRIEELSGGMKRRLMIARALLHNPGILVLDEPTTGLDPHVRQEIWQRLEELRSRGGVTILLSTHYMEEAEKLCERLIVMDRGKILASGKPSELIRESVSSYALEVRDADSIPLLPLTPGVSGTKRNGAHFYFADSPETLAPLAKEFDEKRPLIRPSNLEDVFLQLVDGGEDDCEAI
ncbi:MAG: hypothetical protein AUG51_25205 [Acidobacteria bacterium 13_1_20CM_3_53_8]|nr:MAG: hypothetical protein AUG51_25205 [Acidobacteria bacterium 13_1_20CM_3_53_8]